jgi:6-phosphogluconate dehydrogenase
VAPERVADLVAEGVSGAAKPEELVTALSPPRAVWMMLPAAVVEKTVSAIAPLIASSDVLIDGGNSHYRENILLAKALAPHGIRHLDVCTSGDIWGLEPGYCQMMGGDAEAVARLDPIFVALAPGTEVAACTPGRDDNPETAEPGYLDCGLSGAGHFVLMVHNDIEYGLMAAYAGGLNILRHADAGMGDTGFDAETAPLEDHESYRYDFDLAEIAKLRRWGSVVSSWLLDLTAQALHGDPGVGDLAGPVSDLGEGRWALRAAIDEGVPANVFAAALFGRFSSRGEADFADRILSAMRREFGGHVEKAAGQ